MRNILRVARIQLVNAPMVLGLPVLILGFVLLANIAIFWAMSSFSATQNQFTGALMSIYIVMLVAHLQTMTQMFPFALSLSVTRRAFFGATVLVVLGQSIAYSLLLYVLKLIEQATDGWGVRMTMFSLSFLAQDNPVAQIVVYAVPLSLLSFLGIWFGVVFQRWGQFGAWALSLGLTVLAVAFVAVVSWQQWWPAVGRFFTTQPTLALLAGYPFVLAVVLAAAGYATARRAVP